MKLNRNTYLAHNKAVNRLVKRHKVSYYTQYSYNGPAVQRTKFWGIDRKRQNSTEMKRLIKAINKLAYVDFAELVNLNHSVLNSHYWGPLPSLKVTYKG